MAPITAMPTTTARKAPTVSRTTARSLSLVTWFPSLDAPAGRRVHCAPHLWNTADAALKRPADQAGINRVYAGQAIHLFASRARRGRRRYRGPVGGRGVGPAGPGRGPGGRAAADRRPDGPFPDRAVLRRLRQRPGLSSAHPRDFRRHLP